MTAIDDIMGRLIALHPKRIDLSLDHTEYLGETLALVGAEKAGILKADTPGIIAAQAGEAMRAIKQCAQKVGAPVRVQNEDWSVTVDGGRAYY